MQGTATCIVCDDGPFSAVLGMCAVIYFVQKLAVDTKSFIAV